MPPLLDHAPGGGIAQAATDIGLTTRAQNTIHLGKGGGQIVPERDRSTADHQIDGPFRKLEGSWAFKPLGETACKIEFRLRYEFSSKLFEKVIGPVFNHIANTFVDAFVRRAAQVYGPAGGQ